VTSAHQPRDGQSRAVDALAERFWESFLELHPTTATVYGDLRWADRLDDPGPAGRAARRALAEGTLAEARAIDGDGLGVEDRITRDILLVLAEQWIAEDDLAVHRLRTVDQIGGPQTLLPQLAQLQPAGTPETLDAFLARLHAYRGFVDAHIEILREGLAAGVVAPRIVVERTIEQLERLLAVPADRAIVAATALVADEAARERVRDAVRTSVYPADRAYLEALRGDYLAASRSDPGLWAVPNGEALYRQAIRSWTTLDLDPEAVHQVGLEELAAIDVERVRIARDAGFATPAAYRDAKLVEPANVPESREALVARATEDTERALAAARAVFGRLPSARCEVRPVEEFKEQDAPFAYYLPPTTDASRPGIYYVSGYDLPSRTFGRLAATTYHEAIPGHHFQIALEMEHPSLNTFRRLGARLVAGAYVEGWGLYAERLADELGLYRDDVERFGMLDAQAWRAARLVVDTGLHALRWDRERAIRFMLEAGISETDAVIETDRYIAWPGQALTYMTGMREIRALRRELEERDGPRFDLRAFHDEVLGHGSLPLATLRRELPRWVAEPV